MNKKCVFINIFQGFFHDASSSDRQRAFETFEMKPFV